MAGVKSLLALLLCLGWASGGRNPFFDTSTEEIDSSEFGMSPGKKTTNCNCGWTNKAGKRVVGGKDVGMHEYPFAASLVTSTRRHFCGGTVLTQYHILTAAHCTYKKKFFAVRVGDHDLSRLDETHYTQELQVKTVVQHELYNDTSLVNDIALVVLASPIQINKMVGPACLPTTTRVNVDNQYVKLVGWGMTTHEGQGADILQGVNLRAVPLGKCSERYGKWVVESRRAQVCGYGTNKASCQGDSGGPVVWLDPETNRYVAWGVVSFGRVCGSEDPSVFTDVAAYLDWIKTNIQASSPKAVETCSKQ